MHKVIVCALIVMLLAAYAPAAAQSPGDNRAIPPCEQADNDQIALGIFLYLVPLKDIRADVTRLNRTGNYDGVLNDANDLYVDWLARGKADFPRCALGVEIADGISEVLSETLIVLLFTGVKDIDNAAIHGQLMNDAYRDVNALAANFVDEQNEQAE
ncbi:MAG: hypothetical protein JW966_06760 [Anaerolineae bacterium]|nr:hypothetical protein [Anaerolineae bacterium]